MKAAAAHLECVTLVNEVLLPLRRVVHLGGVRAHQRVEKRVESSIHVGLSIRATRIQRERDDEVFRVCLIMSNCFRHTSFHRKGTSITPRANVTLEHRLRTSLLTTKTKSHLYIDAVSISPPRHSEATVYEGKGQTSLVCTAPTASVLPEKGHLLQAEPGEIRWRSSGGSGRRQMTPLRRTLRAPLKLNSGRPTSSWSAMVD